MEYLKYLDKAHKHPIETKVANKEDRIQWQKEVMPYEKSKTAKDWNWTKTGKDTIASAYKLSRLLGQDPEFIVLKKDNIPVAMMLHLKNFKEQTEINAPKHTSFIWYVQKAPREYLEKHNINEKAFDIKISKAILDVSLTSSLKHNGNILLHADSGGKNNLINFYKKEGFTQIDANQGEKISSMRVNDGRYFYMSKEKTVEIVDKNREIIGQSLSKESVQNKQKGYSPTSSSNQMKEFISKTKANKVNKSIQHKSQGISR